MLVIPAKVLDVKAIKQILIPFLGKKIKIEYNMGRNKFEVYDAKIIKVYNFVFLVELIGSGVIKSFSYADIITKTIKIYE